VAFTIRGGGKNQKNYSSEATLEITQVRSVEIGFGEEGEGGK